MAESKENQDELKKEQSEAQAAENSGTESEKTETEAPETKSEELTESEKVAARIAELEAENAELKDQLLRRAADFDNYRKRMIKENQDARDYGITNLLKDLLDSIDNFDRTLEAAKTASDVQSIVDGVKMVNSSLVSMLENKYGLTGYGATGDAFNPDEHEAIGSTQGPVAEPELQAVYLKGYKLKDKIIRLAKVMVTMPDGSVKAEESAESESDKDKKADDSEN